MDADENKNKVKDTVADYGKYSYADYLTWQMDEMVEIIKGRIFKMTAAPNTKHQIVSGAVFNQLYNFLKKKPCQVFSAPFDVRLPKASKKDKDIFNVVQPDICVICDQTKIDQAGCIGAPDLVIEILSPGNNKKELNYKYEVYEESGVKEYWIIHPSEETILVYTLAEGYYKPSRLLTTGDPVFSHCIPNFVLDLEEVFHHPPKKGHY